MATIKVVNLKNQEAGSVELHDQIAEASLNPFVIKDVVVATLAARRSGTHKTKERSEVSGARRKLFRQKGTGNARVGYAQAAQRRGGGIVFGPRPRSYEIKINKKIKKQALASVLAEKLRNQDLVIVENLALASHKTKDFLATLQALGIKDTALVVYKEEEKNFLLASRNLPKVSALHLSGVNVYDVLRHNQVVITKEAFLDIEGRLLK